MKILQQHEELEMRVLDLMRRVRFLDHVVFGGGTMLRLCFDLPRYSADLDFYLTRDRKEFMPWAKKLGPALRTFGAEITDEHEKHYSFLWEMRMTGYPRRLKIEARKSPDETRKTQLSIAHSAHSPLQVRLRTLTLQQMWINKVRALIDRKEVRDAYDLEFLTRGGAGTFDSIAKSELAALDLVLTRFKAADYREKLGAVLPPNERALVVSGRFSYLNSKISAARSL